ncbi:hypothetical protein GCM10029964_025280 [Kibdelosporangium lantanae]
MTITSQRTGTGRDGGQLDTGTANQVTSLARTTPGVLSGLALLLVVVGLAAGVFSAVGVQRRSQALDDLAARSGPLSVAAQDIYSRLSDADATASGAFLSGGLEPAADRLRYENDIAQASNALAIAVAAHDPADVTREGSPLATLSRQLPVYTGLVETARANNRQGLPLGVAYQREASSSVMGLQLLPAAKQLYEDEVAQVSADQDRAGSFPVLEILVGLILLAVLVVAQVYVRRHTNRVFNVGLVVATLAAVVSLLWVSIATFSVIGDVSASRDEGSAQVDVLAKARIAALQARADETLTLVARGSGAAYEKEFGTRRDEVNAALDSAQSKATDSGGRDLVAAARQNLTVWLKAHGEIRKADDSGDYANAVKLAVDQNTTTGARQPFDKLDEVLRTGIDQTRKAFNDRIGAANGGLGGTVVGVVLLAVIVAVGSTAGIWQRLKEYR